MELLNQMDGFDQTVNVKVIMATNRADTLDPALLRPGRLDRKIEFPLPDRRQKRLVFQVSPVLPAPYTICRFFCVCQTGSEFALATLSSAASAWSLSVVTSSWQLCEMHQLWV